MVTRLTGLALVVAAAAHLSAQEPPLPTGAVQRLGDTRFRPGARITHLAFSPDGKQLASWGNWLYFEDRLSIWDVATGREVHTASVGEGRLADLAWGPGGGLAVVDIGSAYVWRFADAAGKFSNPSVDLTAPGVRGAPRIARPGTPGYERVAFSADGSRMAAARSGSIHLLERKDGRWGAGATTAATFDKLPAGECSGLRVVRDGKAVVVLIQTKGGQKAVVWDAVKGTMSPPIEVPVGVEQGAGQAFDAADDAAALAFGLDDGTVKVIDLPSGAERLSLKKHDGPAHGRKWSEACAVKFVNGGRQILSAGRDNRQLVWDAKTGKDVAILDGHASWVEAVAISPDGRRVATAGQDSLVRLWDATTWKPILPPTGPRETVWRLEVSRDGKHVAAGSSDGVHVWEMPAGKLVRSVASDYRAGYVLFTPEGSLLTGKPDGALSLVPLPTGDAKPVAARGRLLNFTPDGRTLLTGEANAVVVWDWPACTRRHTVPVQGEPLSAAVAPDGRTAVIGVSGKPAAVLNVATGTAREFGLKLHWFTNAAGFVAGGRAVCGTGSRAAGETWGLVTRGQLRQFEPPPKTDRGHFYILSLAVSPDGRRAATCHSDGSATVYEVATGQVLAHFQGHRESIITVVWSPDGSRLLSGAGDHQVLVWDASVRTLAGKAHALPAANRPAAWDQLGTQKSKEALKTIAALAADPDAAVAFLGERVKPIPTADAAALDRIFRQLDAKAFAAREQASRDLDALGTGAIGGVRERAARATSAEVKGRADAFLRKFDTDDLGPDRVRYLRALDVLTTADTPAAWKLVEALAGGAPDVWETEAARQALRVRVGRK
jgi:WD40 repeat protein